MAGSHFPSVTAALRHLSCQRLDDRGRRALRLLGLLPGPDPACAAAAAPTGTGEAARFLCLVGIKVVEELGDLWAQEECRNAVGRAMPVLGRPVRLRNTTVRPCASHEAFTSAGLNSMRRQAWGRLCGGLVIPSVSRETERGVGRP